ncbi:hypothetical protein PGS49_22815, partial [Yersinia intermedia]|nr:hypothetical protein [Yersinia intermedia]
ALGMKFTYYLGDTQSNFTFTTNQPSWTSVSAAGVVTFTAMPTSGTKTVTITATQIAAPHATQSYTFTVKKWFSAVALPSTPLTGATSKESLNTLCASLGEGFVGAEVIRDVRGQGPAGVYRRVPGALLQEWGVSQDIQAFVNIIGSSRYQAYGIAYADSPPDWFVNPSADVGKPLATSLYTFPYGPTSPWALAYDPDGYSAVGVFMNQKAPGSSTPSPGAASAGACLKSID